MLGIEDGNLGTYLCRKGVATVVAADCTFFPPIVVICVKAGWVLGEIKDEYIKYKPDNAQSLFQIQQY